MASADLPPSKIEEVLDEDVLEESSGSEAEDAGVAVASTSTTDAPKKKKKKQKKKSKAAKILAGVIDKVRGDDHVPQELADRVYEQVKLENPEEAKEVNAVELRRMLQAAKIMDVIDGKSGLDGKNRKDMGEHKFWKTQPVPQRGEGLPTDDGPIEPSVPREQVKQTPDPLPNGYEWSTVDTSNEEESREVYELLSQHYVEDHDAAFRFKYSAEFLEWALMPPGYHKEWHVGVRVKETKRLVAFISGVPIKLRVRDKLIPMSEINYLCVHKKLRSKRLAPVLIKEVTRQCHLKGIFQAIYTAGVVLPTPVSTCRYFHRSMNIPKLVEIGFTHASRNMTVARMVAANKLPAETALPGLREMVDADISAIEPLYTEYMKRFKLAPDFSTEELRHNLISGRGIGEVVDGRRVKQVVWSYVVENQETKKITDFFSFYALPSTVMQSKKYPLCEAAYLFYYASDVAFEEGADMGKLRRRLVELIGDALIISYKAKFDVFNALTMMDNQAFLSDLKFGKGDGLLNYYLYNYRTSPLEGVQALPDSQGGGQGIGRGVGVVML